jgi:hypothetical protein
MRNILVPDFLNILPMSVKEGGQYLLFSFKTMAF